MSSNVIVPNFLLKIYGYWKFEDREHWIYKIHRTFGVFVFVLGFSALESMHLVARFLEQADITKTTDDLTHAINHMQGAYKFVLMRMQCGFIQEVYEGSLRDDSLVYEATEELLRARSEAVDRYTAMNRQGILIGFVLASFFIVLAYGSPFLTDSMTYRAADNVTMMTTMPLPFNTWLPFSEGLLPNYYWVFAYQGISMIDVSMMITSFDAMFFGMLGQVAAQFQLLGYAVCTVQQRATATVATTLGGTDPTSPEYKLRFGRQMENELKKCVIHHQSIIRTCYKINKAFNYMMLLQFGTTLVVFCVCLFQCLVCTIPVALLTPIERDYSVMRSGLRLDFLYMIFYAMTSSWELLLFCWFGKEVTTASSLLPDALFSSYWLDGTPKYRSNFRLFLVRSQAPVVFSALGLFPLNLITFGSIIKTGYSLFSVLKQMDYEQDMPM